MAMRGDRRVSCVGGPFPRGVMVVVAVQEASLSMLEQPSSPSALSVHYLVLLVGKYGSSGSSVCVLIMFCM